MDTVAQPELEAPLHAQIKRALLDSILNGRLQGGARVPSEHQLMEAYQVSRITARRALSDLESDGYIYRLQGKGSFVAYRKVVHNVESIDGIARDLELQGYDVTVEIVDRGKVVPPPKVAAKLKVSSKQPVFWDLRIVRTDGTPLFLVTGYFNVSADRFPLSKEETGFMLSTLRDKYGMELARAEREMQAIIASREEARLLQCPEETPMLRSELSVYDRSGDCWGCSVALYRGDRYVHHQRLVF